MHPADPSVDWQAANVTSASAPARTADERTLRLRSPCVVRLCEIMPIYLMQ